MRQVTKRLPVKTEVSRDAVSRNDSESDATINSNVRGGCRGWRLKLWMASLTECCCYYFRNCQAHVVVTKSVSKSTCRLPNRSELIEHNYNNFRPRATKSCAQDANKDSRDIDGT